MQVLLPLQPATAEVATALHVQVQQGVGHVRTNNSQTSWLAQSGLQLREPRET